MTQTATPLPLRLLPQLTRIAAIALLAVPVTVLGGEAGADASLGKAPQAIKSFLQTHCYDCHVGKDAEAGLDLMQLVPAQPEASASDKPSADRSSTNSLSDHSLSDQSLGDHAETWVRIHDRVRNGEMPPPDAADLDPQDAEAFVTTTGQWIREQQVQESASLGRVRGRRLTNLQLERTLHELLGIDIPLASGFSDETRVGGFTTVAEGQAMSHFQLEQHLRAVDAALDEALRRVASPPDQLDRTFSPKEIAKRLPRQRNREPELRGDLAAVWASRLIFYGRMAVTTAKEDGWYRFTIKASALKPPQDHGVWCSVRTGPCSSGAPLLQTIGGFEATEKPQQWTFEGWLPAGHMLEIRPADSTLAMAKFNGGQVGAGEGEPQDVPGVAFHWVRMQRIHRGPDDASVRRMLFGELEIRTDSKRGFELKSEHPQRDAARLMRAFAERAFRRPVTDAELAPYTLAVHQSLDEGHALADALRGGYRALLCSPRFLYFTERPGDLDDYAIASRLSYFLWNCMPDQTLLDLASRSELRSPGVIRDQVRRMLDDPRGQDFVKDLAHQWLDLGDIDFTEPDPRLYRDFDPMVQYSMLQETHQYLKKMLEENLSVSHLIDSDFVLVNSRLARFYGIPGVKGDQLRTVSLRPDHRRGGLLTQGAIMKVTANGTTTSPVIRGVWVSERLLGEHIAPPPKNVPAIEPDIRGATTIREQLDQHKSNDACAVCHVKIDPPGFALENYDPSGKWRDAYTFAGANRKSSKLRIDASHEMPDGATFKGVEEFKQLVLRHPERLAHGLAEKLITYGTGATVRFADRQEIEQMVAETSSSDFGFRSLIESVATNRLFLSK